MARPWRTHFQRERDLEQIAKWYLEGKQQHWIGEELVRLYYPDREKPLSQGQVSDDIQVLIGRWRKAALNTIEDQRYRELEKINHLEDTYYEAWEKSQGARETTLTEQVNGGRGRGENDSSVSRARARVQKEERDGNPAFLMGIQWCIEMRAKLLGLMKQVDNKPSGEVILRVVYEDKPSFNNQDVDIKAE